MTKLLDWTKVFLSITSLLFAMLIVSGNPANAGWREEQGVFKIGIISGAKPVVALRQVEPFRAALQQALNMPVKVFVAADYDALIDAQINNRIQYGIFSSSSFATAWARCKCLTPLAAAKLPGGETGYYSVLIVRGGETANLADLKGKSIVVPSMNSFTGYLLPKWELDGKELQFGDKSTDNDRTNLVIAGTTKQAREQFLAAKVDGIFGWGTMNGLAENGYSAGTLRKLTAMNGGTVSDFQIIWQSKRIVAGPHATSNNVPEDIRQIIVDFLKGLYNSNPRAYDSIEKYQGGGFEEVSLSDYQPIIDLLTSAPVSRKKTE